MGGGGGLKCFSVEKSDAKTCAVKSRSQTRARKTTKYPAILCNYSLGQVSLLRTSLGRSVFVADSFKFCASESLGCIFKMALVNVMNISVLDNPTVFTNPFQFEITFEAKEALPEGAVIAQPYTASVRSCGATADTLMITILAYRS
jgi:hypothetical protein